MIKVVKENLPIGCIYVEKSDFDPTVCPVDNDRVKLAIRFLEGSNGTSDESYVVVDKKVIEPVFLKIIKNIINEVEGSKHSIRFDDEVASLNEGKDGKLLCLDLNDDFSIIGENIAGKLSNLSFSEAQNFANFNTGFGSDPLLVKDISKGGYKATGESSFFDGLERRNENLRRWNTSNRRFLEENNIPYAPEEKHGFLENLKKVHSATSSVSGVIGDVNATIDTIDKLQSWWEKYKTNRSYKREEEISRLKVMQRNKLSSMFLRSRLKKVENDGFESMNVLTSIFNMGYTDILKAPHFFNPDYLKILFQICSICVANALPPNRIVSVKMNISQLSSLLHKLKSKYGDVV